MSVLFVRSQKSEKWLERYALMMPPTRDWIPANEARWLAKSDLVAYAWLLKGSEREDRHREHTSCNHLAGERGASLL